MERATERKGKYTFHTFPIEISNPAILLTSSLTIFISIAFFFLNRIKNKTAAKYKKVKEC